MQEIEKSGFLYDLFISYTRRHTKDWWASWWLYNRLGSFVIPPKYRWENADGKPVKRLRIFRDAKDNSAGKLNETIREKIEHSESLILIASRTASGAEWVDEEVTEFVETRKPEPGKGERNLKKAKNAIYPVVVSGGNEDSSFPPTYNAIRHERNDLVMLLEKPGQETDSPDVRRMIKRDHQYGKKHCFYRILSGATGIESPELERRVFWQNVRMALSFVVTVLLVLLLIYLYKKPRYEYYAAWNDCFGRPKGVLSLSEEQVRHRESSYQFEYRRIPIGEPGALRWRLVQVRDVHSTKKVREELKEAVIELQYARSNGALIGKVVRNSNGKVIRRSSLSDENERKAIYEDFQNTNEGQGISFDGVFSKEEYGFYFKDLGELAKTTISRYVYERDINGFIVRKSYHANNDYRLDKSAVCDEEGVWAMAYHRDDNGNPLEIRYLGRDGTPVSSRSGVAKIVYTFDERGLLESLNYYDIDDQPIGDPFIHKWVITRDEYGNVIEQIRYNTDGVPCVNEQRFCRDVCTYDESGFLESVSYFDESGFPSSPSQEGEVVCYEKDAEGRAFSASFFFSDGKPAKNILGFHRIERWYNQKGQEVESRVYDMKGEFIMGFRNEYDEQGNITLQCIINQEGETEVNAEWGAAAIRSEYDLKGNQTGQVFLDEKLRIVSSSYGFAQYKKEYEGRGNPTRIQYLDAGVSSNEYGHSILEFVYDDFGHIIEEYYYDVNGNPIASPGVFSVEKKWDDYGNMIEGAYFDLNHQRTVGPDGYSFVRMEYDLHKVMRWYTYYDVDGTPWDM